MAASLYVDAEQIIHDYLQVAFPPPVRVCTELPSTLGDGTLVIRIERIGGGDSSLSIDAPAIDVDCFAPTREAANLLAAQVRTALRQAAGYTQAAATVANVTIQSFGWRPYTNTNVRSVGMTANVTLHNHQ
jgi:hypothetical protein